MSVNSQQLKAYITSAETWFLIEAGLGLFAAINIFYYNFPLFLFGLTALYNVENSKPLVNFLILLFLSITLDITTMALYTNSYSSGAYKFGLSMTIIGLVFKPLVIVLTFYTLQGRGVQLPFSIPQISLGATAGDNAVNNGAYQTIQQQQQPAGYPQGGYPQGGYPQGGYAQSTVYTQGGFTKETPATVPVDDSETNNYQTL